jgi:endoglucanase
VFRGWVGKSRGRWNTRYRAVQPLDLSALRTPGRYRVRVRGARSPRFRIADPAALLRPRVAESVAFYRAQRDTAPRPRSTSA